MNSKPTAREELADYIVDGMEVAELEQIAYEYVLDGLEDLSDPDFQIRWETDRPMKPFPADKLG